MSKLVKIAIECPKCSHQYTGDFFRTIWGENEANRSMVMEDRINIAKCPSCGHQFHLPLAMMYVDVQKGFAVWWEPNHDPGIDSDSASYAKMFGVNSYYAKAPRISDWEEFKRVVKEYDDGIRVGSPIEKMDFKSIKRNDESIKEKRMCWNLACIDYTIWSSCFIVKSLIEQKVVRHFKF